VILTSAIQQSSLNGCGGGCVTVSAHDQLAQEPSESPPLFPHHLPQNVVSALPFFNLMIPLADNFGGPVNTTVSPSVDPSGADLPMNGKQSL